MEYARTLRADSTFAAVLRCPREVRAVFEDPERVEAAADAVMRPRVALATGGAGKSPCDSPVKVCGPRKMKTHKQYA